MELSTNDACHSHGIKPGVYVEMSNEDYHDSPGISKSGLTLFNQCPEKYHWRYILGNREEVKPQFVLGSAFHTATLEPHKFNKEYAVGPDANKNTKAWKTFEEENPGIGHLKPAEYEMVMRMAEKVQTHPRVAPMLIEGVAEASIFAECDITGELVKVRPDWLGHGFILDLKSAQNASPDKFFRDMYSYGYYLQAAMYPIVANLVLPTVIADFIFVVVEKEPPYSVGVYASSFEDQIIGEEAYYRMLQKFSYCRKNDIWQGYNQDRIVPTALPGWARKEQEALAKAA